LCFFLFVIYVVFALVFDRFNSQPAGVISLIDHTDPNKPVTQFVYLGDRWNPDALGSSTYVWLPLQLDVKVL
jgi:hypothetical protein